MSTAFQVWAAEVADIECILSLDRSIRNVPHWALAEYLAALTPTDQAWEISGVSRCLFLAKDKDRAVGFAVGKVTRVEAEVLAELESVGVAQPARRAGVGRALCDAVIAWSRRQGASQIELEVRSKSAGPMALYAKLGFVPEGLRPSYYREPEDDAVLMRLMLASRGTPDRDL